MEHARALVLFLHIAAGVLWIGGLTYVRFVLLPTLATQQPGVRGPVVAELGPSTVRYLLRMGEVTIVLGVAAVLTMGRMTEPGQWLSTAWGLSILAGLVGTVAIYGIGQAVTKRATLQIAATVRAVLAGTPPEGAQALLEQLAARQRKAMNVQLAIAAIVVLTMAVARFS